MIRADVTRPLSREHDRPSAVNGHVQADGRALSAARPTLSPVHVLCAGTATPPTRYSQEELLARFRISDPRIQSLFRNSHIQSRYLCLPDADANGRPTEESNVQLLEKHRTMAIELGSIALQRALAATPYGLADIDYIVCVSSTGFLCPGLSAWLIRHNGLRENVHRMDVVGMGCNAGLNGLHPVVDFCSANPGTLGVLICAEICSAAYVFDDTMRTAVVNSLFGDGVGALVLSSHSGDNTGPGATYAGPAILGFESHIIPSAIGAMRFDLDGSKSKFSFYLDRDIPYVIGANIAAPVARLLTRFGIHQRDVRHWLIHSGGRKVIDSIKYNLDLSDHDVRHTLSVLRDYGNLSSGSFLFSYERLAEEGVARPGDYAVMITMGPGSTIESCLAQF